MCSQDIIQLYQQGYSIDYIINQFYNSQKNDIKIISSAKRRIIFINDHINKNNVRGQVYKILYSNLKKDRPI